MIIGVTGSFGSGKTEVAKMFGKHGFKVINLDQVYHSISTPGSEIQKKLGKAFGKKIINKDKSINRQKLKEVVLSDYKKLRKLNDITHPVILKETTRLLDKFHDEDIILDAPLLIEAGFHILCDVVVVVKLGREKQTERLLEKKKWTKKEIKTLLDNQLPLEDKQMYANFIVDNTTTLIVTKNQVDNIVDKLKYKLKKVKA